MRIRHYCKLVSILAVTGALSASLCATPVAQSSDAPLQQLLRTVKQMVLAENQSVDTNWGTSNYRKRYAAKFDRELGVLMQRDQFTVELDDRGIEFKKHF